jgi:hypothetical protein
MKSDLGIETQVLIFESFYFLAVKLPAWNGADDYTPSVLFTEKHEYMLPSVHWAS